MQSLLTAYADNEGDDDAADDIDQHPGADFISDDDEENRSKANDTKSGLVEVNLNTELAVDSPTVQRLRLPNNETGFLPFDYVCF